MRFVIGACWLAALTLVGGAADAATPAVTALAPVDVLADGFKALRGVVVDTTGNVFIADRSAGTITRVAPDHSQLTVATGLKHPSGLALDLSGRLLIAESGANRVARLEVNGSLSTVASGNFQPRWLAVAADGTVFIAARPATGNQPDQETDAGTPADVILAVSPGGALRTFATGFANLQGLAVNHAVLFAATQGLSTALVSGVIFQIPIHDDGSAGPPVALGPTTAFTQPVGIARDALGALLLAVQALKLGGGNTNRALAKLRPDGHLALLASGFANPEGVSFDAQGNLYLTDDARLLRFRAPPPPPLTALPAFTNQTTLSVSGPTDAGARVDIFVNDATTPVTVVADNTGAFTAAVTLTPGVVNTLEIFATGHGGDGLTSAPTTASITHDAGAPSLTFQAPPAGAFVRQTVGVQAQAADAGSGVATLALTVDGLPLSSTVAPALPTASATATASWNTTSVSDGSHTLGATAVDRAGNSNSVTRIVIVDNTPPDTVVTAGPSGEIGTTSTTVAFTGTDNLTPPASLLFAWRLDGGAFSVFSAATSATLTGLREGAHTFDVVAQDLAGNIDATPASRAFSVRLGPSITGIDPGSGGIGTLVMISGGGFEPGTTTVTFNSVGTVVRTVTTSAITTTVPIGATSGTVLVTTSRGSAGATFTVNRRDFSILTAPMSVPVVAGTSVTVAISTTASPGSTDLLTLATSPLPAGVSARFSPPVTTAGANSVLTLTTSAGAPIGPSAIELRATAPIDGVTVTRSAAATLDVQAPGQTVLIGQVTDRNTQPLGGVRILLGGTTLTPLGQSDAGGNFFIPLGFSGTRTLLLDGSPLNTADAFWPTVPLTVTIAPNTINTLGFTPQLAAIPATKLVPIVSGQTTVLTDPDIPGFQMTIPAGVQIVGWDGQPNTHVGVVSIPVDKSPLPPPPAGATFTRTYLFTFGKLGGGLPTGPVVIDAPNELGALPGAAIDLYYFNEAPDGTAPNRWEKYGTATVSSDGRTLVTDVNPATGQRYGMPRFCCGGFNPGEPPKLGAGGGQSGGPSDAGKKVGEPVDAATGFFYVEKTDLILPGIIPIAVTRTYRTNLTNAGPFGLGTSWEWDIFLQPPPNGSANALMLFTPGNRQDLFAKQPDGTFVNTTSPMLRGAVVTVDGNGRTLRFKDGRQWRFDLDGRLASQRDRVGNTVTLTRDGQRRVTAITEPTGRQFVFTYAGTNLRIASARDPINRAVQYGYDASGRLTTVTDPAGGVTTYTYDASHRVVTITDPRGITFLTNTYDVAGRVATQTQADGGVWTYAYTAMGNYISETVVTDPRGNPTRHRFNADGYPDSETDALGQTTTFMREAGTNRVLTTTDPLGRTTRFTYDSQGNIASVTDPGGNVRSFVYEPLFNEMTAVTDPLGHVTRFEYDTAGNLTAVVDPLGNRTTIAYNAAGQPTGITDPLGDTTTLTYDAIGNLAMVADPLGNRTTRQYDAVSRLLVQIDPRGKPTTVRSDALNQLIAIVDVLGGTTRFSYDGNGNLLTVTDARGNTTTYTYDPMDRLAVRTDPVGASDSLSYDGLGNVVQRIDRKGQLSSFSYDALNRPIAAIYAAAAVTLAYDAVGRLVVMNDTAGGTIENQYDILDRLIAQTQPVGVIRYQYDASGRRTQMQAPGVAAVVYGYDAASRLTSIAQAPLNPVTIEYDAAGRRTKLTLPNHVSTAYQYDFASRITRLIYRNAVGLFGDLSYDYDASGNRISVGGVFARTLLPDATVTAVYDAGNRQRQFGDTAVAFDGNGNVTSIIDATGTTALIWDARDRLVGLEGPGVSAAFAYAFDRRISKTVNAATTRYLYDALDITQHFDAAGTTSYLRSLVIDETFTLGSPNGSFFPLSDALASTTTLTDGGGSAITQYTYAPFGVTAVSQAGSSSTFNSPAVKMTDW